MRTGALLVLLGAWLVSRTVTHDDAGRNLVDRLLDHDAGAAKKTDDYATDKTASPGKLDKPGGGDIGPAPRRPPSMLRNGPGRSRSTTRARPRKANPHPLPATPSDAPDLAGVSG